MLAYFSQSSEFTWIFVGIISFLCLYLWYRRPNNFPPGPRGLPIVGVVPFLGKYPERQMNKWSKKYGPIMSVRFGSKDVVVLNDFQSIYQAFVKQQSNFSCRPHMPFFSQLTDGHGIVFPWDENMQKRQRKFGLTTLRRFGVGNRSLESKILEEASYMNEGIRSENGKPFNISVYLYNAVSNTICNIMFGKRFHYDDEKFKELLHRFSRSLNDPTSNLMNSILIFAPGFMKIPPFSSHNQRLKEDIKVVFQMVHEIAEEHEQTFDDGDIRDFVDAFIVEMKKKQDSSFTNIQLVHYVRDMFIGGVDTTSNLLYWSMLCLIHYPQTQAKLHTEVMEIMGRNGVVSMSKKGDMPYTNAFIEELYRWGGLGPMLPCVRHCIGRNGVVSMSKKGDMPYTNAFIEELYRFRTLAPLGILHAPNEDTELNGYVIPKDTMVSANLWAVHNDKHVWKEPEKFCPERFLDEKGNFVRSNNVIAFSMGPRHCLGEQLARMEIFIFLVSMIQKFEFLPDPSANKLPDIEIGSNGFFFVPRSFLLIAKEH